MLSIAFVCFSRARGGLELMLVKLAASFSDNGHRVLLLSPDGSAIHQEAASIGLNSVLLTPTFRYLDPVAAGDLRRILIHERIQIAVIGTSRDISTVILAQRRVPHLKTVFFQQMQSGIPKKDLFHRWAYSRLDRWITLTRAMKEATVAHTVVPPDRIDVVPLGVDLKRFNPKHYNKQRSRKLFGIPKDKVVAGLIGRFDRQKGHEVFLRALPRVAQKIRGAHFVFVGEETKDEPGFLQYLEEMVRTLKLTKRVQFLPFTQNVPELLAAFDLITMPSFSETYGYLALEAMAMGVPVVGTKAGGLPEIIQDNETGLLVPPRDHEALADAVISILANKGFARTLSRKALKRVKESFDFRKSVKVFQDSLTRALSDS